MYTMHCEETKSNALIKLGGAMLALGVTSLYLWTEKKYIDNIQQLEGEL